MKYRAVALGVAACLCTMGCNGGGDGSGTTPDASVALDGMVQEDMAEMPADAMPDMALDAMPDMAVDAMPDMAVDAMPDMTADAAVEPDADPSDAAPPVQCEANALPTCFEETTRYVCVEDGDLWVLRKEACDAGTTCLLGACATDVQQQTAVQIQTYIDEVEARSGHPFPADYEALAEEALRVMLEYEDPQEGLVRGAIRFNRSHRHGHQALTFGEGASLCGSTDGYPYQAQTFYAGICGVPAGDEILVMSAPEGNALGLRPGDTIVSTDTWAAGPTFLEEIAASPACMTRQGPTEASDRVEAAATFFGKIDEGVVLTVRGVDGAVRDVDVPARESGIEAGQDFCLDPFGGYSFVEARLTLREDGVAVIENRTLRPQPWMDAESYYLRVQEMVDRIAEAVAMVPDGAPIIWDIRGNTGGAAEVALGVVAGMPGARSAELSRGYVRLVGSDPAAWEEDPNPFQSHSMVVGDDLGINHRDHPVAVVIDGKTVSAADFFAYAAADFTDVLIVGPEGSSGSFGFGGMPYRNIEGPVIPLQHRVDPLRVETPEGEFLERLSVAPDLVVPYEASDIAEGVDTVIEAAAAALLEPR